MNKPRKANTARPKRITRVEFPECLLQDFAGFELAQRGIDERCDFEQETAYAWWAGSNTGRADLVSRSTLWEVKSVEYCDNIDKMRLAIEQALHYNQGFERPHYGVIAETIWKVDFDGKPYISNADYQQLFKDYPEGLRLYNPASGLLVDKDGLDYHFTAGTECGMRDDVKRVLRRHYFRFFDVERETFSLPKRVYKMPYQRGIDLLLSCSQRFRHWQRLSYAKHSPLLDF